MVLTRRFTSTVAAFVFGFVALGAPNSWAAGSSFPAPAQQSAAPASAVKQVVGTIKAINGKTITLTSDAGANVFATVTDSTRIVRVEPGQTDLKTAVPLTFEELQTGDRILIRGALSADGTSLTASGVIAMKHADLQAKQQQVLDDWQKRGIGGLVSSVDPAAGVINVSVVTAGGARTIAIHTSKSTILRRYAPDSVKFDDAKLSAVADIRPGDQLRARGARSQDGAELTADEIVSGSFRNISGTVVSVDAASNRPCDEETCCGEGHRAIANSQVVSRRRAGLGGAAQETCRDRNGVRKCTRRCGRGGRWSEDTGRSGWRAGWWCRWRRQGRRRGRFPAGGESHATGDANGFSKERCRDDRLYFEYG
jgi:hypothetical protein